LLKGSFPVQVDSLHVEAYLSAAEFVRVFKLVPEDFYRLPKWKQEQAKKNYFLF